MRILLVEKKLIAQINSFSDGQHIYSYKSNPGCELGNPNSSVAEMPHSVFSIPVHARAVPLHKSSE